MAALLREYGPWGLTALAYLVVWVLHRDKEQLHQRYQAQIAALYAERLKSAETIIATNATATVQQTTAVMALSESLERLRLAVLSGRGGSGG